MIQDQLWAWIKLFEVVSRLTLTYLVRDPEEIGNKRHRDQGVEYNLARWFHQGLLRKQRVGTLMAYYLPNNKPGVRAKVAHDCLAGLCAAKMFCDLKGRARVGLSRKGLEGTRPDWTFEVEGDESFRYFLEFHSANNPQSELLKKLEAYSGRSNQMGETDLVLVVTQIPTFVCLPSDHFMLTSYGDLLATCNAWQDPIWHWGSRHGRYSLLKG